MTDSTTTPALDLAEAEKKIGVAGVELAHLCRARWEGGRAWEKAWHWEIPANPERDTDLRIGDAIGIAKDAIAEIRSLKAEVAKLKAAPLQWTKEKPKVDGWYWFRQPSDRLEILHVFGDEYQDQDGEVGLLANIFGGCEWMKIPMPTPGTNPTKGEGQP